MTDENQNDETGDTVQMPVYQSTPTAPRGHYPTEAEPPTRPETEGDETNTEPPTNETAPAGAVRQGPDGIWQIPQESRNDGPLSSLNDEQRSRVAALHLVRGMLTAKAVFGNERVADVFDLIRLAEWVLTGVDLIDLHFNQDDPRDLRERAGTEQ